MADYTKGHDRLHMAYSFDMLGPDFTPAFFRGKIEAFFKGAPDGWPSWSFSNHDVNRHVTRWAEHGASRDALAKQAIAMLAGFEGTIGIYQGEELGQTETELRYEELTDPPGLRFWPENKGRDGCRTPMVWERDAANAGFSTGTPWLPVKPPQAARAVDAQEADPASVLHTYREVLAFRRARPELRSGKTHFLDLPAPCLGFRRTLGQKVLTCLYNLSPEALDLDFTGALTPVGPVGGLGLSMAGITLAPNGFAYLESTPETAPGFRVLTKAVQPA